MIDYKITGSGIIELSASGKITKDEIERTWERLANDVPKDGKIRLLEVIGPLKGIEPAAIWEDMKRGVPMMKRISRAAIVADQHWVTAISNLAGAFTSAEVRTFGLGDIDEARAWLEAA